MCGDGVGYGNFFVLIEPLLTLKFFNSKVWIDKFIYSFMFILDVFKIVLSFLSKTMFPPS